MRKSQYRKPYRIKKKKSILRSRIFWRGILGLVFTGVSLYFFFLSPIFQIKEIKISGNKKVNTEAIRETIQTKNIFLFDIDDTKKIISEKFPQIARVNLKRNFPDKITAEVEERKSVAVFNQGEGFFLIDREGIIFEETSGVQTDLILIKTKSDLAESRLGGRVIDGKFLSQIFEISSKIAESTKIAINEASPISEERLNLKTEEGWEIYFNLKGDWDWQSTELALVLEKQISAGQRNKLKYIDLRFSRVYYKFY